MVGLDMELFDQLAADGLNDLAQRVKEAAERPGELSFLVTSGQCLRRGYVYVGAMFTSGLCVQTDAIVLPKFGSDGSLADHLDTRSVPDTE